MEQQGPGGGGGGGSTDVQLDALHKEGQGWREIIQSQGGRASKGCDIIPRYFLQKADKTTVTRKGQGVVGPTSVSHS